MTLDDSLDALTLAFSSYEAPTLSRCPCGCNAELIAFVEGDPDALREFTGIELVSLSKPELGFFLPALARVASRPSADDLRAFLAGDLARLGWRHWRAEERASVERVIEDWVSAELLDPRDLVERLGWLQHDAT